METNELTVSSSVTEEQFEQRYKRRFGVISGYVPKDLEHIGKWLSNVVREATEASQIEGFQYQPSVERLKITLDTHPELKEQVNVMIKEALVIHEKYEPKVEYRIRTITDMLNALDFIIQRAPKFEPDVSHSAFPISGLFVYMMATEAGYHVFKNELFNNDLRNILEAWCNFLDSPASLDVINTGPKGWLNPQSVIDNNLDQFVTNSARMVDPFHWGFTSFNDFFHRQIIPLSRPLDGQFDSKDPKRDNQNVVVSSNDGTVYRIARDVKKEAVIELKSQPYSLVDMLDNMHVDYFVGGDVFQTFLSGHDYHRWRAPISGRIVDAKIVPGYMFSELPSEGFDPTAGTYSQGYEANVNTRGLIFIDSEDSELGMVCMIPIGITEISSISIHVKKGDYVKKGQELGWFSYGGSSMALVFKKGAIAQYTVPDPLPNNNSDNGPFVRVNAQIAIANTSK